MRKQINVRISYETDKQLQEIAIQTGWTTTQIVVIAIDRLARSLKRKRKEKGGKDGIAN